LALAHVGLCAVLIIAACGQLRSANAFNINHGFAVTSKIAANDRSKVFVGGHGAASSGVNGKPAGRDPHPPGVNRHGAHHDRLVLPTSSRGFIVASRLFSSPDASSSDADGLADKDGGSDESDADDAGGFDFNLLEDEKNEGMTNFKEHIKAYYDDEKDTLADIQNMFRKLHANELPELAQFAHDPHFAAEVIAYIVDKDADAVKRQYGLLMLDGGDNNNDSDLEFLDDAKNDRVKYFKDLVVKYFENKEHTTLDILKEFVSLTHKEYLKPHLDQFDDDDFAVRVIAKCVGERVDAVKEKYGLLISVLEQQILTLEFWQKIDGYKNADLAELTITLLKNIKKNLLTGFWNLKQVQEQCAQHEELKFLHDANSREKLVQVLEYILKSSNKSAKELIECRLAAQSGFVHAALKSFAVVSSIDDNNPKISCFIGDARFRHQGRENNIVPKVFLSKTFKDREKSEKNKCDEKIPFVFYSASGTGKTVEIAGSGYTRGAALTIVHDASKSSDVAKTEEGEIDEEAFAANLTSIADKYINGATYSKILKPIIDDIFERDRVMESVEGATAPSRSDTEKAMNDIGNANVNGEHTISIVLAIDEASACPAFVKKIISNCTVAGEHVVETFCGDHKGKQLKFHNIEVLFSFAGTGASNTAVGSLPENYYNLEPSALPESETVYEVLRSISAKPSNLPAFAELTQTYPVLGCMVKHNARMISIFLKTLSTNPWKIKYPYTQNDLISEVFDKFIDCNGLAELKTSKDQIKVAAQALAVHLFQRRFNEGPQIDDEALLEFKYGIAFDPLTDLVSMKKLVSRYGLVTPQVTPKEMKDSSEAPFMIDETMQLLCLWMLMQGRVQGYSDGLLQTSSFGLEVLATKIVSAVVTASMTLPPDKRPTLPELLQKHLKFLMVDSEKNLRLVAMDKMDKLCIHLTKPKKADDADEKNAPGPTDSAPAVTVNTVEQKDESGTNANELSILLKMVEKNVTFTEVHEFYEANQETIQNALPDVNDPNNYALNNMTLAFDDYIATTIEAPQKREAMFAPFQNAKAAHVTYDNDENRLGTYFQQSAMEVKKFNKKSMERWHVMFRDQKKVHVFSSDFEERGKIPITIGDGEANMELDGTEILCLDTELQNILFGMKANTDAATEKEPRPFFAPLSTLSWGKSPLADGYLVFYAQNSQDEAGDEENGTDNDNKDGNENENENGEGNGNGIENENENGNNIDDDDDGEHDEQMPTPFRGSIAFQGKDSLGTRDLEFDKGILNNKKRVQHEILDNILGKNRIYCVASKRKKLERGSKKPGTYVIGFPVDDSPLLPDMLSVLEGRRGEDNAMKAHGNWAKFDDNWEDRNSDDENDDGYFSDYDYTE